MAKTALWRGVARPLGPGRCPAASLPFAGLPSGGDLDNGWTGTSHNFPVVSNSELRVCLAGCGATSNPQCTEDEAQTAVVNGATFGDRDAWDALGETGQQAVAGGQRAPTTVVDTLDRKSVV